MTNHALIPLQIPDNQQRLATVKHWLDICSSSAIILVCFMPSMEAGITIAVMTTPDHVNIPAPPHW